MSVTTLNYSPAYNSGASFTWSGVTFNSSDGGSTYVGSPTAYTSQVPNGGDLTNVIIGNIVTNIGPNTFRQCSSLSSINIPDSVTYIGFNAFLGCSSLLSIEIPNSVTSIEQNLFTDCIALSSVTIPNSVTSIGTSAFQQCFSLLSIIIPNSVTTIPNFTFYACQLLSSVTIPNSVTSIGNNVFQSCGALSSITIPNSVISIGSNTFQDSSLGTVILPNAITSISSATFASCYFLSSVTIPNSVTSIGDVAFVGCFELSSIRIPNSLTNIGSSAFASCSKLTRVNISDTTANTLNTSWHSPTNNPPGISNFYGAPTLAFVALTPPTIINISPNSGNKDGGTPVTITGTGFIETSSVTFAGSLATSVIVVSDTEVTCVAPAGPAGPVNVVVTTIDGSSTGTFTNNIICFKEGSKILTDTGYKLVQDLRNGDLVKTFCSGFKKIEHIGYSKIYHNVNEIRSKNKLYKCSTTEYPELTEDLVITGCHSILIDNYVTHNLIEQIKEVLGGIYLTDNKLRLPACVDDRTKIFEEEGVHTIWHFSLEHSDYYMNYGVYANGLLVETTSNRMMVELSGMTLV